MVDKDVIKEIKDKLDIVSVIAEYIPELKQKGVNHFARCPFHNEKTPSFSVNSRLQRFKCFGCGVSGDVITFIEKFENIDFPKALEITAKKAGIDLSKFKTQDYDKNLSSKKNQLFEINKLVADFFHYLLTKHPKGEIARTYLSKRGIENKQIIDFKLGYAPSGFENLKKYLTKKGYKEDFLVQSSLLIEKNGKVYDKFRHRIVFPIFNPYGDIVGFSARVIKKDDIPKYLNSGQTLIFQKSETLYGLYQAKQEIMKNKFVIIVEGNVDIISAHKYNVKNIVAPMGTAITLQHLKILKRYTQNVHFCFDSDDAGLNALIKANTFSQELGLDAKVIDLEKADDLDDFIKKYPDKLSKKIQNAEPVIKHLMRRFAEPLDFSKAEDKSKFVNLVRPILSLHKDPIEKVHYAKEVASLVDVEENLILDNLESLNFKLSEEATKSSGKTTILENESTLLAFLLQYPYLRSLELDWSVLKQENIKNLFNITIQNADLDITLLDDKEKEIFSNLYMYDLGNFETDEEIIKQFKQLYKKIQKTNIRNQLKEVNKQIRQKSAKGDNIQELLQNQNKLARLLSNHK